MARRHESRLRDRFRLRGFLNYRHGFRDRWWRGDRSGLLIQAPPPVLGQLKPVRCRRPVSLALAPRKPLLLQRGDRGRCWFHEGRHRLLCRRRDRGRCRLNKSRFGSSFRLCGFWDYRRWLRGQPWRRDRRRNQRDLGNGWRRCRCGWACDNRLSWRWSSHRGWRRLNRYSSFHGDGLK